MLHPIELPALPAPAAIAATADAAAEPVGVDPLDPIADPIADPAGVAIAVAVADTPQLDLSDVPPAFSDAQQRGMDEVVEIVRWPVRQRILLALASGGRANVGALAARLAITQKTLSHHLAHLRTAGLVFSRRSGKCIWYEAAPDRVRYQRHAAGHFSLTVTARDGGVSVTLVAGVLGGSDRVP